MRKKVIIVHGWGESPTTDWFPWVKEDAGIADPWLNTPLNFEKIKSKANSFTAIFSDNDPFIPLEENKKIFEEKLGAKVIVKPRQGHFDEEVGTKELPVLMDLI